MRTVTLALLALLSVTPFAGSAHAASDLDLDCSNPQDQPTTNACAAEDLGKADEELNEAYKKALKAQAKLDEIDPEHIGAVEKLKKAERAWIVFRDAHCDAATHGDIMGTAYPTLFADCESELTRERTKQLGAMTSENN